MSCKITIKMNSTAKILARLKLNKNGEAQKYFTKQCAKYMNNFCPYDTGYLKDGSVQITTNQVIYNAKYARINFYSNRGNGKQGTSNGGNRGKRWDIRMWQQKGKIIIREVASFVGGEVG